MMFHSMVVRSCMTTGNLHRQLASSAHALKEPTRLHRVYQTPKNMSTWLYLLPSQVIDWLV
jgi:hypothetical protein